MAQGRDIQWSGRAVRWLLWRAPARAVRYTWTSNLNLASDLGRRWAVWVVFGLYLWAMRWLAAHLVPPLRTPVAVLILVWFWHGVNLVRWSVHARAQAAQARAWQREMYQTVTTLPAQLQQWGAQVVTQAQGGIQTMRGSMRHHDPAAAEHEQIRTAQAEEARSWLPTEQQDMPLGDRFEPVFRLPRWLRRKDRRP